MRILILTPFFSPTTGGVETHLDNLCDFLVKRKHTVYVRTYQALMSQEKGQVSEESKYLKIHRLPWPDFNLFIKLADYPILQFLYLFTGLFFDSLFFLITSHKKIDVIQAHGFVAALIAVILGKQFDKRVVVNTHVGFRLKKGIMTNIIKWILLNCKKILVLTKGIKNSLIDLGIPEYKIKVYHYWIDQKKFKRIKNAKRKLGWENKFIILFVGRLIEVKGVRNIFKLAAEFKKIYFVIVGMGPLSQEIQKKNMEYKNIKFIGKINNKDLPLYYSASDILLIPSQIIKQEYEEGIPRVMIEALFCSLPVISTCSGGISDVFDNKIGKLVEDNVEFIESTIKDFYQNKKKLSSISKNTRSYALKHFNIQNARIIENSFI